MDLVDLVEFVGARKQGEEGQDFEEDAAHAPDVHLLVLVAVRQEALGRTLPPCGYLLREGRGGEAPSAGAEVGQLEGVAHDEDVLGFDVPVEDAEFVHVVDGLEQLLHLVFDARLRELVASPADGLLHVHVHEFEDQRQAACGLVLQYFY